MIIINNKKFAETEKEFVDSVFTNQTCVGYAKRYKKIINGFNPCFYGCCTESQG